MTSTRLKIVTLLCGTALLGACSTARPALHGSHDGFGQAVKANIAAQAIAPSAEQKANTYIPANAARTAAARRNYREGTVPEPEPISTTQDD